ncbi:vacuolar protein sorting-associated protein 72 homolog [Anthonomus grandis grandis]|uniref:vacuolar protein sorting-associated protein 72 homolog n=1 Tax=Anthonomus grandis grandis TaxID=2921223 RepID=UPI002166C0B5|nr:vacuolar protein sorting-associated protein 72 homolog [Anthonomus grandis grandis]
MERERRSNAGNRMAKLLDEEEECQDDFYKQNYGGFEETESDNEYQAEKEEEDIVDSDFSIDENDEPVSDTEDGESQKKKRRLVTKAYKEPVVTPKDKPKTKPKSAFPKVKSFHDSSIDLSERKSKRKSTAAKSAETAHRIKVRDEELKNKPKKSKEEEWVPTQEELLEEAKITEEENLKSLERYQKLESEKKTKRITKKAYSGPLIRYTSTRMPLIEEIPDEKDNCKDIKAEPDKEKPNFYERTFITILNDPHDVVFKKVFNIKPTPVPPKKLKCAVTGLPALYVDPVTWVPYRNSTCLKIIRQSYYQELEKHGDKSNPMVADFVKWFTKNKDRLRREMVLHAQKISITS